MSHPPQPAEVSSESLRSTITSPTSDVDLYPSRRLSVASVVGVFAAQVAFTLFVLRWLGRNWWCELGDFWPWILSATSAHTSQHLIDPYTFTHIAHGFIFCGLLTPFARQISVASRFLIAVAIECFWEIFENTPFVIDRYRTATAALGYEGDSIANSIADVLACASGFFFAMRFDWRTTILVFAAFEIFLLVTIRDSLVLNILMLCYPVDAIRHWQLGIAELKSS